LAGQRPVWSGWRRKATEGDIGLQ